jgi:hypothetical protein
MSLLRLRMDELAVRVACCHAFLAPDDLAPDEAMRECFTGMANGMTNTSYWRVRGSLVTMLPPL